MLIDSVIAATLWTDFEFFGEFRRAEAMALAGRDISDFHRIQILDAVQQEARRFDPNDALRLHQDSRLFLEAELGTRFDGISIVMTHHAPSSRSVPSRFATDPLSAAYVSDLDDLIERTQPHLWAHGHLHTSSDYMIGSTRVVCNPRGYYPFELNPNFDPELVVEIG